MMQFHVVVVVFFAEGSAHDSRAARAAHYDFRTCSTIIFLYSISHITN